MNSTSLPNPASSRRDFIVGNFLVFTLLAVSAIEYFYRSQEFILVASILSGIFFLRYRRKFNRHFTLIVLLFLIVECIQYLLFGGFNVRTFLGTYVRLFLAFSVVAIVNTSFFKFYVNVLYGLCIASLLFYIVSFMPGAKELYLNFFANLIPGPKETDSFYESKPNIVIFTFHESLFDQRRNSGPFWEPGAFAVFLLIALLFNHQYERKLSSRKNLVFIICLLTTFSTAGYISFFLFIIYVNFHALKRNLFYLFTLICIVIGVGYFYEHTSFLKEKVERNIELADETTTSRFGSALADYNAFKSSPLVGLGRAGAKHGFISEDEFTVENHRNNGVFDLLSKYGLPLTVIYFVLIYFTFLKGIRLQKTTALYATTSLIIILALGFSQGLFLKPFFYAFLFLPFIHKYYGRHHQNIRLSRYTQ